MVYTVHRYTGTIFTRTWISSADLRSYRIDVGALFPRVYAKRRAGSESGDLHPYHYYESVIQLRSSRVRRGDMPGQISRSMRFTRSGRCTTEQLIPPHRPPSCPDAFRLHPSDRGTGALGGIVTDGGARSPQAHLYRDGKYDAPNNRLILRRDSARAILRRTFRPVVRVFKILANTLN